MNGAERRHDTRSPIGRRIFRCLLRAYPRSFRRAFEAELLAFFDEDLERARAGGVGARLGLWARTLLDLTRSAWRQRLRPLTGGRDRDGSRRGRLDGPKRRDVGAGSAGPASARLRRPAPSGPTHRRAPRGRFEMTSLISDLRLALRALRRAPGFFAVAVVALALGIGATTAIWSIVDGVLVRSLPYPEAERLVEIGTLFRHDPDGFGSIDGHDFLDLRASVRTMDTLVASSAESRTLLTSGEPRLLSVASVTAGFFDVLGGQVAIGRALVEADYEAGAAPVVVLAHPLWRAAFGGDTGIVGRTVDLDGEAYVVVGVMSEGFRPPEALWTQRDAEAWTAHDLAAEIGSRRGAFQYNVIGRLAPGATLAAARAEVDALYRSLGEEHYSGNVLGGLVERLEARTVGDIGSTLGVMLAASTLLLLIACANVANLLIVRAGGRQRELAVRSALGAGRGRIVRQLLTESLLLAALGGAGGALLGHWSVELLRRTSPVEIPRLAEVAVDARVLAFAVGLSTLTGVVFGVVPALLASRADAAVALKTTGTTAPRARLRLRSGLVVAQAALSLILLVGAVLLANSFVRLATIDPGFDPDDLVTLQVRAPGGRDAWAPFFEEMLERVRALPGVGSASLTAHVPYTRDGGYFSLTPEGWDPAARGDDSAFVSTILVSPGHLANLGVPLAAGRWLTDADRENAPRVALVNRAFLREFWPDAGADEAAAVGRRIEWERPDHEDPWMSVVGVVGDIRYRAAQEALPEVYVPLRQDAWPRMSVVARADGNVPVLAAAMRQALRAMAPDLPIQRLATMNEIRAGSITEPRFYTFLGGAFATSALLIALVGVYGTVAYAVVQRTRELGVRVALGARHGEVVALVVGHGMRLVALGVLAGVLGSLAATRLLAGFLFGIAATDPASFLIAAVLFLAAAAVAGYLPARRVSRLDPVSALRTE